MAQLQNVERLPQDTQQPKMFEQFRSNSKKYGIAAALVASPILFTQAANAADGTGIAATILAKVTAEVEAVGNSQEAIYGLLIVILVGFLVWRYGKRTVNSG